MNKREWLASQGLAEIGKRGRFSREAEAAWANHMGPDPQEVPAGDAETTEPEIELPRDGFHLAKPVGNDPIIRDCTFCYAVDEDGRLVAHDFCGTCRANVARCDCEGGPDGPKYLPKQKSYLVKP